MRLPLGQESHPLADTLPMIDVDGVEMKALVSSMKARGYDRDEPVLRVVTRADGTVAKSLKSNLPQKKLVLDGRNRIVAAHRAGVTVLYRDHLILEDGTAEGLGKLVDVVFGKNLARRNLNDDQRAMIAARLATLAPGRPVSSAKPSKATKPPPKGTPPPGGITQEEAAARLNVSVRSLQRAKEIQENAIPEVRDAVDRGKLPVASGAKLARKPAELQRKVAARVEIDSGKGIRPGQVSTYLTQEKRKEQAAELEREGLPPPSGPYRVIVVDWPWKYETRRDDPTQRGQVDYAELTTEQGCSPQFVAFMKSLLHPEGTAMWFWITNPFLVDGEHKRFFDAWGGWKTPGGWHPRALLTWDKVNPGNGNTLFNITEHCILATIGDPPITVTNETTLIREKKREHSRKPEKSYDTFDAVTKGSRIELFSRAPRDGYAQWGKEAERFEAPTQRRLAL